MKYKKGITQLMQMLIILAVILALSFLVGVLVTNSK